MDPSRLAMAYLGRRTQKPERPVPFRHRTSLSEILRVGLSARRPGHHHCRRFSSAVASVIWARAVTESAKDQQWGMREELDRVRKVADTLCTGHAGLRDRFSRRALILDILILFLSTWLVALAFVEPKINVKLTPFGLDSQVWGGLLAIGTFLLSVFQLKTDWKSRSDAHRRTVDLYAEVKREAGYLLASGVFDEASGRRVLDRYDIASAVGVEMPEADFLRQKRRHKIKVALSKHLDTHPSASIFLTRVRFWWRDNVKSGSQE